MDATPKNVLNQGTNYKIKHSKLWLIKTAFSRLQFMMFFMKLAFFIWLTAYLKFMVCIAKPLINLPENTTIPAVMMFGDSLVDTGNNNFIITFIKSDFPPYGQDFMGGKPTGRFSNGKVPPDIIAEELGVKPLLPAYLDPDIDDQDLITGVNFASGAAGYDPLTSDITSAIPLSEQLELLKDYIANLEEIVGEDRASTILNQSLFAVVAGSNDLMNTYYNLHVQSLVYDISSYVDLLVSYASGFMQDLYALGARRIGVFGVPPLGCAPFVRSLKGGYERSCIDEYNEASQLFNEKLSAEINSINYQFPESRIIYIDLYGLSLDLMQNPDKYGFKIGDKGCCGTGTIEAGFLCHYSCSDVSDYVFWDSFHLTEKAYRFIVHQILKKYINRFV